MQGITVEVQAILDGRKRINPELSVQGQKNTIHAKNALAAGSAHKLSSYSCFRKNILPGRHSCRAMLTGMY